MKHTDPLRVLFATSEAQPLVKTGGLGDVSGSLPPALRRAGVDARILLPAYSGVIEQIGGEPVGGELKPLPHGPLARLYQGTLPGDDTPVYALACPALYERSGGPYVDPDGRDWPDNALRFGLLSRVAALFGCEGGLAHWLADVIHANDWQTGLSAAQLAYLPEARARIVLTVHNIVFQGNFPRETLTDLALPPLSFSLNGVEYFGRVSFLKAGLVYADHIVAVSPTYAEEIQTSPFGSGMEGVVAARRNRLSGVLNGIDVRTWDPSRDPHLPQTYGPDSLDKKAVNRRALQERFGLDPDPAQAVLGMVTRLTWQKGIDLVLELLPTLLRQPVQIVLLGAGDRAYEARWRQAAEDFPGRVGVLIGFDEPLAHLVEGGADAFLMPSRFEPCGLNQMYSMRYGTPPIVRQTGGLADSVVDTTPATLDDGTATGFVFQGASEVELLAAIHRALLVRRNRANWRAVQRNGMTTDFSWDRSAAEYVALYHRVLSSH